MWSKFNLYIDDIFISIKCSITVVSTGMVTAGVVTRGGEELESNLVYF